MSTSQLTKRISLGDVVAAPVHRLSREEVFSKLHKNYQLIHTMDIVCRLGLLLFTEEALSDLLSAIQWGRKTPLNVDETQVSMVGRLFQHDGAGDNFTAVCEYIIPVSPEKRTLGSSQMTPQEELVKDRKIDALNLNLHRADPGPFDEFGEYIHLGYAHTHPGNLQVFFSETDKADFDRMFDREGVLAGVAVVANPQRKKMVAFGGRTASPLSIAVALKSADSAKELSTPCKPEGNIGAQLSAMHEGTAARCESRISLLPQSTQPVVASGYVSGTEPQSATRTADPGSEPEPFSSRYYCSIRNLVELGILTEYQWLRRRGTLKVLSIEPVKLTRIEYLQGFHFSSRVFCQDGTGALRCLDILSAKRPPLVIRYVISEPNTPIDAVLSLRRSNRMIISI